MLIKAKSLHGYELLTSDGIIGSVKEFYFDDEFWTIRYLIADTGNWLVNRKVLISPHSIKAVMLDKEEIAVSLSRLQIENSPPLDSDKPVSRQYEDAYYAYYSYPSYWSGPYQWGAYPYLWRTGGETLEIMAAYDRADHHLRSSKDVTGHKIHATDGEFGHVHDFIIDDTSWEIRYLVIDTGTLWKGNLVLVAPKWIDKISWTESLVYTGLTKQAIETSPAYDDKLLISQEYEAALYDHYQREPYWAKELVLK